MVNEPAFRPLPHRGVSGAQTQWSIFPLLTMRACSGRLPAEETGPHSGPLPGGPLPGERMEKREKEVWKKDGRMRERERAKRGERGGKLKGE